MDHQKHLLCKWRAAAPLQPPHVILALRRLPITESRKQNEAKRLTHGNLLFLTLYYSALFCISPIKATSDTLNPEMHPNKNLKSKFYVAAYIMSHHNDAKGTDCSLLWAEYTERNKKTETFENPNKNWRNPRKKMYWQKLNHYNLPFKRQ